ncbi:MAG: hypothetical protein M5U28_45025 [Sandaracinaceae bacterium]|nr:hypothetical protein [Sandaracinaceae bacterium]
MRVHEQAGALAQSASAQSSAPSQSSSTPLVQLAASLVPPGHTQLVPTQVAPPGPHASPAQSASAQSAAPSQSSSMPSPQAASAPPATCVQTPAPSQVSVVQAIPSSGHAAPAGVKQ